LDELLNTPVTAGSAVVLQARAKSEEMAFKGFDRVFKSLNRSVTTAFGKMQTITKKIKDANESMTRAIKKIKAERDVIAGVVAAEKICIETEEVRLNGEIDVLKQ